MKLPKNLTVAMIVEAVERQRHSLDNPGFCLDCGAEAEGCEPDMRKAPCESCGAHAVYGAEDLLIRCM
jgi:hypothetical protein